MSADTIRLFFTYVIAAMVLVGCFLLLIFPSQVGQEGLIPFVTGVVGVVLGFVFNRESTIGGARAAERAMAQGAAGSPTTVNTETTHVDGGNPTVVNTKAK
jgi:fatty acid desaturase